MNKDMEHFSMQNFCRIMVSYSRKKCKIRNIVKTHMFNGFSDFPCNNVIEEFAHDFGPEIKMVGVGLDMHFANLEQSEQKGPLELNREVGLFLLSK